MIRRNQTFLKSFHGVDPHLDIGRHGPENLFDEDDQVVIDLAGEMKVENISNEVKESVEKSLMLICKDLLKVWNERQTETGLQKAALEALGKVHEPDPDNIQGYYKAREQALKVVVEYIPGTHKQKYDAAEMVDGYASWNRFQVQADKNIPMNKKWIAWISKMKNSDKFDDYSMFIEFFECIQIRSMSEAMAETVGSIMNINSGTGRQLQPVNFSVEICLRFNLGPLHTLSGLVNDVVENHGKDFFRKALPRGMQVNTMSVANANFRKKEESSCHIPYKIFK